jgi:erythromycin esterase-like protein
VRPGLEESYEAVLHDSGLPQFLLLLTPGAQAADLLDHPRLERAIGVIYKPAAERWSHYFEARLPQQFDALIHLDETRALEPLERTSLWTAGEPPETFPTGL